MTERPENIPPDIWSKAIQCTGVGGGHGMQSYMHQLRVDISNCILREREIAVKEIEFALNARDSIHVECSGLMAKIVDLTRKLDGAIKVLEPFRAEAEAREKMVLGEDIDHWPIGGSSINLGHIRAVGDYFAELYPSKSPT